MINLTKETKVARVLNATAAGTSTLTSSVVDMKGYDGCTFACLLGDVTDTSVLTLTVQSGAESDGSDMANVTESTTTFTADATNADSKVLVVEVNRPLRRYVRVELVRSTANAAVDGILAIQTDPQSEPTTHDSSVVGVGFGLSPTDA